MIKNERIKRLAVPIGACVLGVTLMLPIVAVAAEQLTFEKISVEDVSEDELSAAVEALEKAVLAGDETLTRDTGATLGEKALACVKANPKMNDDAVAEIETKANEAMSPTAAISSSTSNNSSGTTSSSSSSASTSGPSSSNSTSSATHEHNWQPTYRTVHHNAVIVSDAKAKRDHHRICNTCNAEFSTEHSDATGHGSYHDEYWPTGEITYTEYVAQEAYDEQVLWCYTCSICGKDKAV